MSPPSATAAAPFFRTSCKLGSSSGCYWDAAGTCRGRGVAKDDVKCVGACLSPLLSANGSIQFGVNVSRLVEEGLLIGGHGMLRNPGQRPPGDTLCLCVAPPHPS